MRRRTLGLLVGLTVTLGAVWSTMRFFSATALPGGNYALWRGAVTGNAAMIRPLATRLRDVNEQDVSGWTPLLLAAGMGHTGAVQALLEKGANVDVQDKHGRTALMRATTNGYDDIVRLLLLAGADTNLKDTDGNTALHHAAYGRTNLPNADLWARGGPADLRLIQPPLSDYARIAGALLANGADVRCKNHAGQSALSVAIGRKNSPVALMLKRHQAKQ